MYSTACRLPSSWQLPVESFHAELPGRDRIGSCSLRRCSIPRGLTTPTVLACVLVSRRRWILHKLRPATRHRGEVHRKASAEQANTLRCDDEGRAQLLAWAESQGIRISPKLTVLVPTSRGRGVVARDSLSEGEMLISGSWGSALVEGEGSSAPRPELEEFWRKWPEPEMRLSARLLAGVQEGHLTSYVALLPHGHADLSANLSEASSRGLSAALSRNIAAREALSARGASDLTKLGVECSPQEFATALNAAYTRGFKLDYDLDSDALEDANSRRRSLLIVCAATCAGVAFVLQSAGVAVQVGAAMLVGMILAVFVGPALTAEPPSETSCLALLPVADLINHGNAPLRLQLDKPGDDWELQAGRDFSAGEEVVFNYEKNSDQLLLDYGFVEDTTPAA